jgi:RHS repeat-associated protein
LSLLGYINSANQITVSGVSYDAAGDMTNNGTVALHYDAENRICSVGGTSCTTGTMYYYDGDGKRVRKSGGTMYWYGAGSDPLLETDSSGNLTNEYIFFGGKRIARRDSSSNIEYYFSDHLGSGRVVTNASGASQETCYFYSYGGSNCSPSGTNDYLFTGKERDSESGLDNFGARYDSSQYGRFMVPDPLMASATIYDPQTWNRYAYARNNPLKFIDPTGMVEETADQCKKDKNCVTVRVNVIYDRNANLTDKQKDKFNSQLLQQAKDQYGDAKIHLDVSYTQGGEDDKGNIQGLSQDSINVIVSDRTHSGYPGESEVNQSGYALTQININTAGKDTLSHEFAHDFLGDTTGFVNSIAQRDPSGIVGTVANTIDDVMNDAARSQLGYPHNNESMMPGTAGNMFNRGASQFQDRLTQQAAIRPRQ